MVTAVKHEWHQHDRQYCLEIDEALLSEIYPDLDEEEIAGKLSDLENGEITVDDIVNDAYDNDVDLEWDFQYDDCWTDRKGGYEVHTKWVTKTAIITNQNPHPIHTSVLRVSGLVNHMMVNGSGKMKTATNLMNRFMFVHTVNHILS